MRWIVRVVVAIATLVLLVAGALALVPAERVAEAASARFEGLTGRKLQLEGGVSPTLWPNIGVRTGPVSIANAAWSDEGPMLKADALTIEINLSALLGGEIRILGIDALRPEIILERSKDGAANWVFGGTAGGTVSAETPGVGQAYTLDKGLIREGSFVYIDHQTGRRIALDAIEAEAAIPDFAGPLTITGSAVSGGQPVRLSAEAGTYSAFTEGRVVPFKAELRAGGSTIGFDGRFGTAPLVAEGALVANLADVAAVAALAGTTAPALPQGFGATGLALTGQMSVADSGALLLRAAEITADGNRLTGNLELAPGEARPKLSAQLTAGPLVLTGVSGGKGGGSGGGMKAEGWPTTALDVSGMGALDLAVALVAPSIDLGMARLGPTGVMLTMDRSRAVFDIREMAAYGGQVTGEFVVNGRGGLSVGGKLAFAGLAMQPLLTDLAGYDRLIGTGNLEVQFLGVGNSIDAIMRSLKGQGALELGKGELRGLDIGGMLRTLDTGFVGEGQKTIFDALAGTFSMADGVLSNSDLKLVAPYVTASGAGEVGIGTRTLNYRLRPTALADADGTGGVMVPLMITGSWAAPKFRLDLESIAREKMEAEAKAVAARLEEEAKAAEAAAKAELEQRLREELGVEVAPEQSLGDAAKDAATKALEDQAVKALEEILNGN